MTETKMVQGDDGEPTEVPLPASEWSPAADLYNAFVQWAATAGHKQLSKVHFSKRLRLLGLSSRHTNKGTVWAVALGHPHLFSVPSGGGKGGTALDV